MNAKSDEVKKLEKIENKIEEKVEILTISEEKASQPETFQCDDFSMDVNNVANDTDEDNDNSFDFNVEECPRSSNNENVVRFYYLDAFEDSAKHPGLLFIDVI